MIDKIKKTIHDKKVSKQKEKQKTIALTEADLDKLKAEAENMTEVEIKKNKKHFSIDGLWEKIKKYSKKAGTSVIYVVLLLYFTMMKPEVPKPVKLTIAGALGYFILPFDMIPDLAPGIGYVDDFGVLMAAIFQVLIHIDEDVKTQARNKLNELFGEKIDTSDVDEQLGKEQEE